jgi:uncharacterized membrane protein YdfJ with MMPL/SSD domain
VRGDTVRPMLDRIAAFTWMRPRLALALAAAFALIAGGFGHGVESHLKAAGFTDSASESEHATAALRGALGYDANPGIVLVVRPRGGGRLDLRRPAVRREVARLRRALAHTRYVGRVFTPLDRDPRAKALVARDGRSAVLSAHLSIQDVESDGGDAAEDARRRIGRSSLHVAMGGFATSFNEVNDQTRRDLTTAELIAFPALSLLLLLVFRGVVAAAIPLIIGGISIVGTFFVLRVLSSFVGMSIFALNITTALSLGLAVDYALLMVSRYREELERDGPTREAHRRTVLTAGRAALFSGGTVAAAMVSLVFLPQRFLYSIGLAGASVGLLTALMCVLVVPSMLRLLGPRVNALAIRSGPSVSDDSDRWYRLARGVMRRPGRVALAAVALVLVAAAPLGWMRLTGPSAQAVPSTQPSYDANAYLTAHYPRDVSEAATVTVRGPAGPAALAAFRSRLAGVDGVARAGAFTRGRGDVAFTNLALSGRALDPASQRAVKAIRALPPPPGADVLVSGNTARFIDQKASLVAHAPIVLAIVAATTLLLIFLLTGSVLLPVKTLLMNGLTLGTTFGVLVLAFQDGWLKAPLGYDGPASIEVTSLVFLSAVTFGLATDYAVLVMARIKEQHDNGLPNEEAVATGIARTGRVITAAAMMIAVVFLAFAVSPVFFMKQIAIGTAVGVIVDATVVRALLVPALMRLLGDWNWWAPPPLRRAYARWGLSEAG